MIVHPGHGQNWANHSLRTAASWWNDNKIVTDLKRRKLYNQYEDTRNLLKAINVNQNIPERYRWEASFQLRNLPLNSHKSRIRNRSIYSSRARGVLPIFRMDRIVFRNMVESGVMPGISRCQR